MGTYLVFTSFEFLRASLKIVAFKCCSYFHYFLKKNTHTHNDQVSRRSSQLRPRYSVCGRRDGEISGQLK